MRCRLVSSWVIALSLLVPLACSDDGVPQEETGGTSGNTDATQTATNPTTDDPSTTSPTSTTDSTTSPSTSGTTTDPGTTDTSDTDPGSSSSADSSGTTDASSSSDGSSSGSSSDGGTGVLETGAKCIEDGDCASGVCWDFNDYDELCFGAACSVQCMDDADCTEAFEEAGAPAPGKSFCGKDNRCWVIGTGLGGFACAMEPAVVLGGG